MSAVCFSAAVAGISHGGPTVVCVGQDAGTPIHLVLVALGKAREHAIRLLAMYTCPGQAAHLGIEDMEVGAGCRSECTPRWRIFLAAFFQCVIVV